MLEPARQIFPAHVLFLLAVGCAGPVGEDSEKLGASTAKATADRIAPRTNNAATRAAAGSEQSIPPGRTHYMGREIAQTMHWRGATWLMRKTREEEEHASRLMEALHIKEGQTVCDLGCGNGYHTLRLAKRVGPSGKVLAVDIQIEMLKFLEKRLAEQDISNVEKILSTLADPKLPENSCDMILLVDVYHEFSHPELMLAAMRRALKPKGRLVLVEFRSEDPDVPIKRLHKMSKEQINKELLPNGYRLAEEFDELPWQHVMMFERDEG